jgi:hypothetical protein
MVERRLDEGGDVARPEYERRGEVDFSLVVGESPFRKNGQLIAEPDDVSVTDPDSSGANTSDEGPAGTLEVLEIDAVGANLDPRVTRSDIGSDDAHVGPFVAADHGAVARGDDLDPTVLAR